MRSPRVTWVRFSMTCLATSAALLGVATWSALGSDQGVSLPKTSRTHAQPSPTTSALAKTPPTIDPAPPGTIAIPAIELRSKVLPYTLEDAANAHMGSTGEPCLVDGVITCINPPRYDTVYWQQSGVGGVVYGDTPASTAEGNVYLMGHASHKVEAVFTQLFELKPKDVVQITTDNGRLDYLVEQVIQVGKDDYTSLPEALNQVPGRLLLITCYYGPDAQFSGNSATDNVVVVAQLDTSRLADV